MLFINVSSAGNPKLKFRDFENYGLPAPRDGADVEINDDLILKFEDEDEAIAYAEQLEDMAKQLSDKDSPQYAAINGIIMAIYNDEFVKSYSK
ncbi:MAG TPA: hypothetical protein VIM16_16590 [Mucilaginibacter sp.]|jgi:hypothetical protein